MKIKDLEAVMRAGFSISTAIPISISIRYFLRGFSKFELVGD